MKTRLLTLFAIALMPGLLYAGTACATPTVVPADGRVVDFDFVANSPGANFYQFDVSAGNSYSVEVRQDYDDLQATNDLTTTAFSDVGCSAAVAGMVDTTALDPALPGNSSRFSFTAATSGTIRLKVANGNATSGRYRRTGPGWSRPGRSTPRSCRSAATACGRSWTAGSWPAATTATSPATVGGPSRTSPCWGWPATTRRCS